MTVFVVVSLAFVAPAFSQQPQPVKQKIELSDGQMKEFFKLQKRVYNIQQGYTSKANEANDQAAATAIMQQAGKEMTQVIERSSFSVEQFNHIVMLLNEDEKLQQEYRNVVE